MALSIYSNLLAGEDTDLEYKQTLDGDKIKRAIVAFANDWQSNGGGTILVGVADDGTVLGLTDTRDTVLQTAAKFASDGSIEPTPLVTVETECIDSKLICKIQVQAGQRRPYMWRGSGYIRIGTTSKATTHDENMILSRRNASVDGLQGFLPAREEITIDFIGRKAILKELWDWLGDPYSRRVGLVGQGGSGKSAIAYHFASAVMNSAPEPFTSVLWLSAKSRRMRDRTIEAIKPDFWDLQSAVDRLLLATGYEDMIEEELSEKLKWIELVVSDQPALIVVDDYDSLFMGNKNPDVANCIDLFTDITFNSKSKLLVTSRVDPRGGLQQSVSGFPVESRDGADFIDSRLGILGMERNQLSTSEKRTVLKVTGGIPLFIEDLLRLYKLRGDFAQTISNWRNNGGQRAREFAIKSEFDSLQEQAKVVLLATSLLEGQVSIEDIAALTGYGTTDIENANLELQGLFLMSPPTPDGETTVFRVNENIAQLVRNELKHTRDFRRVSDALRSIKGNIYENRVINQKVGASIRKAHSFVRAERYEEAENVILDSFDSPGLSEHPDLRGALGWIYKRWSPIRRTTEARKQFERSAELRSSKPDCYVHWTEMEIDEQNWSGAISAADLGFKQCASNLTDLDKMKLGNAKAFAMTQIGRRLKIESHPQRAVEYFRSADKVFREHLFDPDDVPQGAWRLRSMLLNGLVQNSEAMYDITGDTRWFDSMISDLRRWEAEHAGDFKLRSESHRIKRTYSSLL